MSILNRWEIRGYPNGNLPSGQIVLLSKDGERSLDNKGFHVGYKIFYRHAERQAKFDTLCSFGIDYRVIRNRK